MKLFSACSILCSIIASGTAVVCMVNSTHDLIDAHIERRTCIKNNTEFEQEFEIPVSHCVCKTIQRAHYCIRLEV